MPAWHEATWVDDPDAGPQKKRRFRWAWAWLLLIPAALMLFSVARSNNYWQYTDMTVTTLQCQEPVSEAPAWADLADAGCAPAAIGAQVALTDAGRHPDAEPESDGTTWTFEGVPSAFSTLAIDVQLAEPAGRVLVVNPESEPPTVVRELLANDTASTMFAGSLGELESTSFQVVVAPLE